jgi:pimeloyl-ACP methyl ester carboxylesterase
MNRRLFISIAVAAVCLLSAHGRAAQPRIGHRGGFHRPPHLLVVLIGGIDSDPTAEQIDGTARRFEGNSGLYRLAGDLAVERVIPEYFNWNGTRAGKIKDKNPPQARGIAAFIRQHLHDFPADRVAIIGNSWGAHTALEALQHLGGNETPQAVHLAVFLDPSSTGRVPIAAKSLPINVNRAVNYYTRNMFVWGKWDAGPRLKNIDLGDPDSGYTVNGEPAYHAKFNMQAHIAAEWDEQIHEDIARHLAEQLLTLDGPAEPAG